MPTSYSPAQSCPSHTCQLRPPGAPPRVQEALSGLCRASPRPCGPSLLQGRAEGHADSALRQPGQGGPGSMPAARAAPSLSGIGRAGSTGSVRGPTSRPATYSVSGPQLPMKKMAPWPSPTRSWAGQAEEGPTGVSTGGPSGEGGYLTTKAEATQLSFREPDSIPPGWASPGRRPGDGDLDHWCPLFLRAGHPQGAYLCDMVGPGWGETVARRLFPSETKLGAPLRLHLEP